MQQVPCQGASARGYQAVFQTGRDWCSQTWSWWFICVLTGQEPKQQLCLLGLSSWSEVVHSVCLCLCVSVPQPEHSSPWRKAHTSCSPCSTILIYLFASLILHPLSYFSGKMASSIKTNIKSASSSMHPYNRWAAFLNRHSQRRNYFTAHMWNQTANKGLSWEHAHASIFLFLLVFEMWDPAALTGPELLPQSLTQVHLITGEVCLIPSGATTHSK